MALKVCPECMSKPCERTCSLKAWGGRAINGASKDVLIAMDPKLVAAIDRQAKGECRNRSDLIREACRIYVGMCERPERPITIHLVERKTNE